MIHEHPRCVNHYPLQARGPQYVHSVQAQLGSMPADNEELVYWAVAANIPNRALQPTEQYDIVFGNEERRMSHAARLAHVWHICESSMQQ